MNIALSALLLLGLIGTSYAGKVRGCYWGTWANYYQGNGRFEVSNIDPNLCTHLYYAFFGIDDNGRIKVLDSWLAWDLGYINKAVALKQRNPNLKVIASVGGWSEGSTRYSQMAGDWNKRKNFIDSVTDFLRNNGFDGMDLDWEYPAQRGGSPSDKENFVTLLRETRERFNQHGFELSIAVAANGPSQSYNIPAISQHIHYINVMTYDFAGSWQSETGFNAPLFSVEGAINHWLNSGAPSNKVVLGVPFYGRTFRLKNSQMNWPGAPASGGGNPGPYTQDSSYLGYNEICENINSWSVHWDNPAACPYAYKGDQWVGYDNVQSINRKMDFVLSKNLAGAMVWSIETDDFRGICGQRWPLLTTIKNRLN